MITESLTIRFKIDRIKLFGRRIPTTSSIAQAEVKPAELPNDKFELLHKHLLIDADDNCNVVYDPEQAKNGTAVPAGGHLGEDLVEAEDSTLDSLLMALEEIDSSTEKRVAMQCCLN